MPKTEEAAAILKQLSLEKNISVRVKNVGKLAGAEAPLRFAKRLIRPANRRKK